MAKYIGSACRLCRREGVKLFLKGTRCVSEHCAIDKRSYKPGMHGQGRRGKLSDFGVQLREKQKAKTIYGVLERQFRNYFKKAEKSRGITGEVLLQLLERRLDNLVFRSCFANSRPHARQMVIHGLIMVNDKIVNRPSYSVNEGDTIRVKANEDKLKQISQQMETLKDRGMPGWIKVDDKTLEAKVERMPNKEDIGFNIQEQLIIELYSK
ncbi:MAG: 30S ribosomal protein S4 [Candidatus Omnitrophota bacterium]